MLVSLDSDCTHGCGVVIKQRFDQIIQCAQGALYRLKLAVLTTYVVVEKNCNTSKTPENFL